MQVNSSEVESTHIWKWEVKLRWLLKAPCSHTPLQIFIILRKHLLFLWLSFISKWIKQKSATFTNSGSQKLLSKARSDVTADINQSAMDFTCHTKTMLMCKHDISITSNFSETKFDLSFRQRCQQGWMNLKRMFTKDHRFIFGYSHVG